MAQIASPYPYMTVAEYLASEDGSDVKHEYADGYLYAMTGASVRHNKIIGNLYRLLSASADGSSCEVLFTDVKLRVGETLFYYPDLMVACDPEDQHELYRTNPCLVVEVLSPSTEAIDRREKLFAYRQIPGLQTYLMIWQDRMRAQRHLRSTEGTWSNAEVESTGRVPLLCPEVTLTLDDIYRGVG